MDGTQIRSTRKTSTDGGRSPKVSGRPKTPASASPKKRIPVGGLIVGAVVVLVLVAIIFGGGDIAEEPTSRCSAPDKSMVPLEWWHRRCRVRTSMET